MTTVKTNIDHNIDDKEFNEAISKTASLIRYQGKEYLDKLNQLNSEYQINNVKVLTERELAQSKQ